MKCLILIIVGQQTTGTSQSGFGLKVLVEDIWLSENCMCCFWPKHFNTGTSILFYSFQIETIELPIDPKSKKRRGFIFITYKEEASVKKCLEKKYHNIQGGRVCIHTQFYLSSKGWFMMPPCYWRVTGSHHVCVVCISSSVWAEDRSAKGGVSAAAVWSRPWRRLWRPGGQGPWR